MLAPSVAPMTVAMDPPTRPKRSPPAIVIQSAPGSMNRVASA